MKALAQTNTLIQKSNRKNGDKQSKLKIAKMSKKSVYDALQDLSEVCGQPHMIIIGRS